MIRKIFFSWQSDLPSVTNTNAIRKALRSAKSAIEETNPEVSLLLLEATSNEVGAVHVPTAILKKIREADVFVADISAIVALTVSRKSFPNPNVMFELGYAVAYLGWNRIILIYNLGTGDLNNLPFDIDRQRVSTYNISLQPTTAERNSLAGLMTVAVQVILESDPDRPITAEPHSPEEVQRRRDIDFIRLALSTICFPILDEFIRDLPSKFWSDITDFWHDFDYVMNRTQTHITDPELGDVFRRVHRAWGRCLSHSEHYEPAANIDYCRFGGNWRNAAAEQLAVRQIAEEAHELDSALRDLGRLISERYTEIDINETNRSAWTSYVSFHKKMDDIFRGYRE